MLLLTLDSVGIRPRPPDSRTIASVHWVQGFNTKTNQPINSHLSKKKNIKPKH